MSPAAPLSLQTDLFVGTDLTVVSLSLQVDTDLTFSALSEDSFDGQITKDLILEDTLHFLLTTHTHLSSETQTEGRQVRLHYNKLTQADEFPLRDLVPLVD